MATLPGPWRYRVSAGTGWHSVSILWLSEIQSFICSFYLSVAACAIVWADMSPYTLACCWGIKQPTNKQLTMHPQFKGTHTQCDHVVSSAVHKPFKILSHPLPLFVLFVCCFFNSGEACPIMPRFVFTVHCSIWTPTLQSLVAGL